jgi:hypothetical protein
MMPNFPNRFRRAMRRSGPLFLVMVISSLLVMGVASAGASSNIEGVWAFDNGQIAITPEPNGTFVGTVVAETKFAECTHEVGQRIWTEITPQPDGSYWGLHQWYFEKTCAINTELGKTAWRVVEQPNGARALRVCLSLPGTPQPTIPASGPETNVSYGCIDSALTSPLAGKGGVASERLSLPSTKKCLSARLFKIHLRDPKYDPFKRVVVTIKGRKIPTQRRGNYVVATINLHGFKRGAFTLKIHAVTVLGHHLSGSRTYHTCAKTPKRSKPAKLR